MNDMAIALEQVTGVKMKIDFVSDVSCPWCVIGLKALEQALDRVGPLVKAELHFQPFELNPQMWEGGQEINEHLQQKYGSTPQQLEQTREHIRARGAELGFEFGLGKRNRVYNTFDAHRLLHWAGLQDEAEGQGGKQLALKQALFSTYFTEGNNPGSHEVLLRTAEQVGLDRAQASEVLQSGRFTDEVRQAQQFYQSQGIRSVPAVIINDQHLISGGHPPEVFEQALRQIAAA